MIHFRIECHRRGISKLDNASVSAATPLRCYLLQSIGTGVSFTTLGSLSKNDVRLITRLVTGGANRHGSHRKKKKQKTKNRRKKNPQNR